MPLKEFWYGDLRLLGVYQKAYLRDKSYTAWLNGQYSAVAYNIVMANAFAKKGTQPKEYPMWKDPFLEHRKEIITNENLEQKFREVQVNQNLWLHNMMNR